ncbi:MAG: hypothetical protein KGQ88_02495, partial [Chloroflexi bacterium]|nr:hypothetical protein [Chloroflexota bacterium]
MSEAIVGLTRNRAKEKLASGGYATGTWLQLVRTPSVVRLIAAAGFDMVFIDMEHSSFDWQTVGDMCELARAEGIAPIVRPYDRTGPLVNRVQDLGAMGLVFHDVTSRAEVDELLRIVRYPPDGHRGVSAGGPAVDYRTGDGKTLQAAVNAHTLLAIQVESAAGVDGLDGILRGGGVDLVEIGRADLSTSLGVPLQPRHQRVLDAVDRVVSVAVKHGVAVGVTAASPEDAEDLIRRGVRSLGYG